MNCDKNDLLLYAVTDRHWLDGRRLIDVVRESLDGGVTMVQLREKTLEEGKFLEEAKELQTLCRERGVPFLVNDNVEIAREMNADGVHVGQSDMEAQDVRAILGPDKILGVSAQTVEQAVLAEKHGADYLGVGAPSMNCDKNDLLLYAVTDRHWLDGRRLIDVVRESLDGGVTMVQLREKTLEEGKFLEEAKELQTLCRERGVPFLVNDNVEIAREMNADGVHVGQSDMEAQDVRAILGPDKILGVSAQTVEQAVLAEKHGADYLGVGAVFPTGSKDDADDVSYETLKAICGAVSIPVVAIGGITQENVAKLAGSGICGVAVISAIYAAKNIQQASADLKAATEKMLHD